MSDRSKDWMNQAVKDLTAAEGLIGNESFEWACFVAQQAAEKALKGVFQRLNAVGVGALCIRSPEDPFREDSSG